MLANRYRNGLRGLVDRVTGQFRRTTEQNKRERDAVQAVAAAKYEEMVRQQTTERRRLRSGMKRLEQRHEREVGAFERLWAVTPEETRGLVTEPPAAKRAAVQRRRHSHRRHHGEDEDMAFGP